MNSLVSNYVNVGHMEKPSLHEHPLFEITWVVDICYFVICSMPHLRLTSLSMHMIMMKLLIRESRGLVIGWPVISFNLVINKGLANGPVCTKRALGDIVMSSKRSLFLYFRNCKFQEFNKVKNSPAVFCCSIFFFAITWNFSQHKGKWRWETEIWWNCLIS